MIALFIPLAVIVVALGVVMFLPYTGPEKPPLPEPTRLKEWE